MKAYYTYDGKDQQGPMTLEELLVSGIHADTQIWHDGLESWTAAKNIEELKLVFAYKPPPPIVPSNPVYPTSGYINPPVPRKKKSGGRVFLKTLGLLLIIAGIVYVIFARNQNVREADKTAPSVESNLLAGNYERAHPDEFLTATGTYSETLPDKKLKILGLVTNKATVANFKDIVIEVRYNSSTKKLIKAERFVVNELVPANSTKTFEWKIKPPKGTASIGWDAVGGVPYF